MTLTLTTVDVARVDGLADGICVANSTARRVDKPRALLHVLDRLLVDEILRASVQRRVDGNDVAGSVTKRREMSKWKDAQRAFASHAPQELLEVLDATRADLLAGLGGQVLVVVVEQLCRYDVRRRMSSACQGENATRSPNASPSTSGFSESQAHPCS